MASARGGAQHPRSTNRRGDGDAILDPYRGLSLLAAAALLLSSPVRAEKWEVMPTLGMVETYSDNISLAQDSLKRSDWVTQVIPSISVRTTGPRFRFDATYAPEILYYAETRIDNNVLQRGNAIVNAELSERLFFIEAGGRVDQYNVSLQGPLTANNVNLTGNRATAATSFISPYVQYDFGSAFRGEARFTYSKWRSDDPLVLANNDANRVNLRLLSGPAFKALTWNVQYRREAIDYETGQETLTDVFTADVRRLLTSTVALLGQAGYEKYDSGFPGAADEGARWSAGFEWSPTPRTRLVTTAGKRFFGDTYGLDFTHRTRITTWRASYGEDVTTARAQFFLPGSGNTASALDPLFVAQFPDPVARQRAVEQFIAQRGFPPVLNAPVNFFTDQMFLTKSALATAAIMGVQHTVIANAFADHRRLLFAGAVQVGTGDFALSNAIRQTGASLAWNWRLTARNAWNLGAAFTRREYLDTHQVDDLVVYRMGFTRQFQPKISGSISYRRQNNDSTQIGANYTENAGIATLRVEF